MMLLPSSSGNLLCLLFMLGFGSFVLAKLPPLVRVGSVFLETEQEVHEGFRLAVESLKSRQLLNETDIEFDIQYATPRDFFHLYTRACVELGNGAVSMFGPSDPALDEQLESISNVLGVPLISTASRTRVPHTSDVSMDFTLSLHPTQNQLMNMIKDLAKELKWKDISIIHDPAHGIIDPTSVAESLQILGRVSVHKASTDLRATLVQLRLAGARNVIVDTSVANVQSVIQAALDTGMMTKQYSYIFTMLDMKAGNWSRLSYSEALVFGFNIIDQGKFDDFQQRYASSVTGGLEGTTRLALTLDAVELLARGLEALDDAGTDLSSQTPVSCTAERKWDIGEDLKDAYSSVTFDGLTGPISFSNGLRSRVNVDILKLNYNNELGSPSFVAVGNWSEGNYYDGNPDGLQMLDRALLTNEKPEINKTLIVTTMPGSSCMIKSEITGEEEGFCVDLADHLSKLFGFYYKFKTVNDGYYGKADPMTGQWDGMIGEVIRGEADLALADLTVTAARESVVDFTTPFLHTSLAILYKNADASMEGISSLLSPFSIWVWVSIALAFFVTSVSLRFVAWLSPFQKDEIIIPGSERSPSLGQDLSWINSMWLLASTLVLRGCDIRLQSASSRTIAIAWWLFSLLVLVIYASLVSHWFDVSGGKGLKTIEGLLQNAELEIGVIRGGSTHNFLQNAKQDDLQKVWWRVQKSLDTVGLQPNTQAGIEEVQRSEGNFAFMSEERNVERALADDCSLGLVGGIDMRAFAVAVSKGSPLRAKISEGILMLRENGVLHQLEEKWWPTPACEQKGDKPQVQLVNFVGPLTMLVFGVVVAVCLAMIERLCYHRRSHRGFFRTATENGNGKIAINQMHDTEST